ncbi:MAG TPA: hypothetical protein PLN52_25705, partial [Opitutaceae bacterium]|nr:hypothetical protein [Opitutaceae bacterium]
VMHKASMVNAAGQNEYTEWWNEDLILLNAMAKYEFKVRRKPISIQVNVENLLDNDQIDFRGVTTVGGTT